MWLVGEGAPGARVCGISVLGLGVSLALGCGAGGGAPTASTPATAAVPAATPPTPAAPLATSGPGKDLVLADPPGFEPVGRGDGVNPAPIYVTISLNINDFMRPEREAKAVRRFLDDTRARGIDPVELSFTGEVLDALQRVDPGVIDLVKARKPTINEHYRLLQFRKLLSTARELFYTDPATSAMDRSRYGSLVMIQKVFGVTPRDNGGVIAEMLRAKWSPGPETSRLRGLGVDKVNKNDLIIHPDRVVAGALEAGSVDPDRIVEAYLTVFRQMERVGRGEKVKAAEVEDRLTDLTRWTHLAKLQGIDVAKVEGLSALVDASRLGAFMEEVSKLQASEADLARLRARPQAEAAAALDAVFKRLYDLTSAWRSPATEVRDRLALLDPNTAWVARVSWHATDDYTQEGWSEHIIGREAALSGTLVPAGTRPDAQQQRVISAYNGILQALKDNPRVQFISVDQDTQWLASNSPEQGYPAVFGTQFSAVPGALDPDQIDAMARSQGLKPPSEGAQRQGAPHGEGGAAGGPPRGPRPGGGRPGGPQEGSRPPRQRP